MLSVVYITKDGLVMKENLNPDMDTVSEERINKRV